jgi:hypothetical protein
MKKLIIRDDDTCFFTAPHDLDKAFDNLISKGFKVTLSVIPETSGIFRTKRLSPELQLERKCVWDNAELVAYICDRMKKREVDLSLHGFTHEYKEFPAIIPELKWKSATLVERELKVAISNYKKSFGKDIKSFVPPSNALSAETAAVIARWGLNISGVIETDFNRSLTISSFFNYCYKIFYKAVTGRTIPYVLDYRSHKELTYHNITPNANVDEVYRALEFCSRKNLPFVLSSHYWELLDDSDLMTEHRKICHTALDLGYQPAFLDDAFL